MMEIYEIVTEVKALLLQGPKKGWQFYTNQAQFATNPHSWESVAWLGCQEPRTMPAETMTPPAIAPAPNYE